MDKQVLLSRQSSVQARFTELQGQSEAKRKEIEAIEDELKRLQGKFAELDELLKLFPNEPQEQANTVTAAEDAAKENDSEPKRRKG